jgi:hypothetical protein
VTAVELAPPRRRSYSQLDVYLQCPAMYKHKYVDRQPEEPAVWTVGGTAFHEVAERFLRGELPNELKLWMAWLNAWEQAKAEVLEKNPLATDDMSTWRAADRGRENAAWWMEHGFDMVKKFVAWWPTTGLTVYEDEDGLGLERQLETELGGVPVVVIPDALVVDEHGQLDILDYKSGKPPRKSLQLGTYKAGIKAALGLDATWGLYFMTRAVQLLPVDLHQWPHDKIVELFVDFDTRERKGDYEPTPGDHCNFCPLKRECPVGPGKR